VNDGWASVLTNRADELLGPTGRCGRVWTANGRQGVVFGPV
jgi:hypothetical protein